MDKKIYIISFHRSCSHGALLQCLASQVYVHSLGFDSCILDYRNAAIEQEYKLIKKIDGKKGLLYAVKSMVCGTINLPFYFIKKFSFQKFRNRYLFISSGKIKSTEEMNKIQDAGFYLAGSDQIWNTDITGGIDKVYFLDFETEAKKVSLAASIGKDNVSQEERIQMLQLIKKIDYVTVRETNTKTLFSDINKKIDVICDPVFLPKRDYWINIARRRKFGGKKYILIYALSFNQALSSYALELSKKTGMRVLTIARNFTSRDKVGKKVFAFSPEDLLFYIFNSDLILTNSFHGAALSIVLRKNFKAFCPSKRGNRLIELLDRCGLNSCIYNKSSNNINANNEYKINYFLVEKKIEGFSNNGRIILKNILNGFENDE